MTALKRAVKIAGTASALAKLLGVRQSTVWDWMNVPGRKIIPEAALQIEHLTHGEVTVEELRPDLAAVFRKMAKRRKAA